MANRIDSIISRGMGEVKGLKARLSGLVGVFRTLAEQHGEVTALIERVRGNPDKRAELWPTIRRTLLSHERGEVRELFPVLRAHAELRKLADRHDKEARELEQLIKKLDQGDVRSEAWGTRFDQLAETVSAHTKEEENEMFPAAQRVIGEDRAKQLERTFLAAQQQIAASV